MALPKKAVLLMSSLNILVSNIRWRWLWLFVVWPASSHAGEDQPLFANHNLRGSFEQTIFLSSGERSGDSRGEFALMAPHYFRWQTLEPGRQLLLMDGEFLWQYDQDLETLSRHAVDELAVAPLELLLAPRSLVLEQYTLTEEGDALTLVPKADDSGFRSLTVELAEARPHRLTITDNLGQRIEVSLHITDDEPTRQDFIWQMPDGVELMESPAS